MPKYYVQSGPVKLVVDARNAKRAAVKTFQWSCDRQSTIESTSPLDHVQTAETMGWQLEEDVSVSEQGFDSPDAVVFDTLDVVAMWQGYAFPWG